MYQIYSDDNLIYDLRDDSLVVTGPLLVVEDNCPGSLTFKIHQSHPRYQKIKRLSSTIKVFYKGDEIFEGRVIDERSDWYGTKEITCEGELAYLSDSVQRAAKYQGGSVRDYLSRLLDIHNSQVSAERRFYVGAVTVVDSNDYVYKYTNYETTLEVINEDLLKTYGGHLRVRKQDGKRYLDYLADWPRVSNQEIRLGKNLLSVAKNYDLSDLVTVIIPRGAKIDEDKKEGEEHSPLEKRVGVESVNGGNDYITSPEAVKEYGWICRTVTWDDVHVPANLLRKAAEYLKDMQFQGLELEVSALDLSMVKDIDDIRLLDEVRVVSRPHGLDRRFPVVKVDMHLDHPSENILTMGQAVHTGISGSIASAQSANAELMKRIDNLPPKSQVLDEARDNATKLIRSALNGHVVITENADELLIMDTDDIKTAKKLWRWNLNGLGYSRTGYDGTYETAITMDGQIVGERIVAGSISASKLDISYRRDVEKKISDVDSRFGDYWTATKVYSEIKNYADNIKLAVTEEMTNATDNRLRDYYTKSQIDIKTDSISSEVRQKVGYSEVGTQIRQNAYSVRMAWNDGSNVLDFQPYGLNIYDYSKTDSKLRARFDANGNHFYRDGYDVGFIGTNSYVEDDSKKGLTFNLETNGAYMAWAWRGKPSDDVYTMRWTYVAKSFSDFAANTLAAGCDIDMRNYKIRNIGNGFTGTIEGVLPTSIDSDGTVAHWRTNLKLVFVDGILTQAWG